MVRSVVQFVVPLCLGALGGLLAGGQAHPAPSADVSTRAASDVALPAPDALGAARLSARVERLERAALEARAAEDEHAVLPIADVASTAPGASTVDPEVAWTQTVAAAYAEPVDGAWAKRTESALANRLHELGEAHGFALTGGRCGTARCVFKVQSTDDAPGAMDLSSVLHGDFDPDCARAVRPDAGGRTATLVMECEEAVDE